MKNKKLLKNVVYLAVLAIVLAASTINLLANQSTCSSGEYLNRKTTSGEDCFCGGVFITQASCNFQQWSTCIEVKCF